MDTLVWGNIAGWLILVWDAATDDGDTLVWGN